MKGSETVTKASRKKTNKNEKVLAKIGKFDNIPKRVTISNRTTIAQTST